MTCAAAAASAESGAFVIAIVGAPWRRAASTTPTTSGEAPDWLIPMTSACANRGSTPYRDHDRRSGEGDGESLADAEEVLRIDRRVVRAAARGDHDRLDPAPPKGPADRVDVGAPGADEPRDDVGLLPDLVDQAHGTDLRVGPCDAPGDDRRGDAQISGQQREVRTAARLHRVAFVGKSQQTGRDVGHGADRVGGGDPGEARHVADDHVEADDAARETGAHPRGSPLDGHVGRAQARCSGWRVQVPPARPSRR